MLTGDNSIASRVRIALIATGTVTFRRVGYNSALCVPTTRPYARISTLFVNARKTGWTFRVSGTFRAAIGRATMVVWYTRTDGPGFYILTHRIRSAG